MGQCYCQLSLEERIEIYRLHAAGELMQEIARSLKRHVSTISREIHRNGLATKVWPGGYAPARAQKLAERRRRWDGDLGYSIPTIKALIGHSRASVTEGYIHKIDFGVSFGLQY